MATKTVEPKRVAYPKQLGICIDMLYAARAIRLAREKEIEQLKADEKALGDHIMNTFAKSELDGAKGRVAVAAIKQVRTVKLIEGPQSWLDFWQWARKDKLGIYVQRRPGVESIREQIESGVQVPGVELMTVVSLSLTKVS